MGHAAVRAITSIERSHWFLNRAATPTLTKSGSDGRIDCCVRGPEVIELDQDGNVVNSWGGPGYHPLWPTNLQTVIPDSKGFVWVAGTGAQDSILKFTRDGKFVWDFDHRPPKEGTFKETNQNTDMFVSKGRFQLDESANEIYIINQKRVWCMKNTGALKRGWAAMGCR